MALVQHFTDSRFQTTLATFFVTFVGAKIILNFLKRDNSPPGPRGVPLLGYLPFFGEFPYLTFLKLREKYGDIFSVKMGSFPAVILHGKELIKEALVDRGDDFSGRPEFLSFMIVGSETLSFVEFSNVTFLHRKMTANALQTFANARHNPIEEIVNYEARVAVSEFTAMNGKPFYPRDIIFTSIGSIIFQICYGRDSNIREEDPSFIKFTQTSSDFTQFSGSGNPVDVMPFLRYIMPWKLTKFLQIVKRFKDIRERKVEENMKTFSADRMRHLADGLITSYKTEQANPNSVFSRERIFSTLDDITGAGFESISTTLTWTVLILTAYPDIQQKVHNEIDSVLGKRQPTLQDKPNMKYCTAVINEVLRFTNIVPFAIPHAATRDTQLCGYTIRKGTIILPNTYSISHDKDTWGDPETFRPERYLDADGNLNKTTMDQFNIFGMGRRKCLGEFLARMELFLFLTNVFQNCQFIKPSNAKEYTFDSILGLTKEAKPFEVCVSLRD